MKKFTCVIALLFMCSIAIASNIQDSTGEIREFDYNKKVAYEHTSTRLKKIKRDSPAYKYENYKMDTIFIKDCDGKQTKLLLSSFEINGTLRWFSFIIKKQNALESWVYSSKPESRSEFNKFKTDLKDKDWADANFWGCDN